MICKLCNINHTNNSNIICDDCNFTNKLGLILFFYFIIAFITCFILRIGFYTLLAVIIFISLIITLGFISHIHIKKKEKTSGESENLFVVSFSKNIFFFLKSSLRIDLYLKVLIRKISDGYEDVEVYVLFWFFLSIFFWAIVPLFNEYKYYLGWLLLIGFISFFSVYRIFEIVVYQSNVLIFDYLRKTEENEPYEVKGYTRLVILLLLNYITIIFSFAILYQVFSSHFGLYLTSNINSFNDINQLYGSLYFSTVSMSTLGHGDIIPITSLGRIVSSFHTLIAVFINLILIARFVSFMPRPWTKDRIESRYMEKILKEEEKLKK